MQNNQQKIEYAFSLSSVSGTLLGYIRENMGLTQTEMGKLFDLSHAAYRSMEKGETAINVDFILMLGSFINVDLVRYFGLIQEMTAHLIGLEKDDLERDCQIILMPNSRFNTLLKEADTEDYRFKKVNEKINILLGQNLFNLLPSKLKINILDLTTTGLSKNSLKKITNITSEEVSLVVETLKTAEEDDMRITYHYDHKKIINNANATAFASFVLPTYITDLYVLVTGLTLFEQYKRMKERNKKAHGRD